MAVRELNPLLSPYVGVLQTRSKKQHVAISSSESEDNLDEIL